MRGGVGGEPQQSRVIQEIGMRTSSSNCPGLTALMVVAGLFSGVAAAQPAGGDSLIWKSVDDALEDSRGTGRLILVDVYAPWCGWCYKMKEVVYRDRRVARYLEKHFETARLNFDNMDRQFTYNGRRTTPHEFARRLGIHAVPSTLFLRPDGRYLHHISGYAEPSRFMDLLTQIVRTTSTPQEK